MFEIYILLIIFVATIVIIYKKFYQSKYTSGEWLTVNRDIKLENDIDWDITDKSVIRIVNFKKWTQFFFGSDLYTQLKKEEGIVMKFDDDCVLDVCDENMDSIHHIVDPKLIMFAYEDDPRIYKINPESKYIFFLRTDVNKNLNSKIYKFKDMKEAKITGFGTKCQLCYLDEDELFKDFYKECEKIRDALSIRGYQLVNVTKSDEYLSFPNNSISNKVEIESELGDVLILVTTNKSVTSEMKNHKIEVNSENNSFYWQPDGDTNISHLLLDNCDQDDTFCFYERTTNIKNGSNILPFQVLTFRK